MKNKKTEHNIVEKVVFGIGIIVLITLLTYLVLQISREKNEPPQLLVTSAQQDGMIHNSYKVIIKNIGEETAESVTLKMSLYQNGKSIETGSLDIDYVPVNSTEIGFMVFYSKPKPNDSLVVSSVTYLKP